MVELRTVKGTKDYSPLEQRVLNDLTSKIIKIFKLHGAVNIDTPTFELRDLLVNKYGEESKLIFDLEDQGGDICSLRYDLTVSFSRYLAMNKIQKIKRYQLGKVFRRDNPSFAKGRLREFTQCDFDIAGSYLPMVADAETLCILHECLKEMNLGKFKIKFNHRGILNGIISCARNTFFKFNTVCSSLDKLDKFSFDFIKEELKTKGLNEEQIEFLHKFVYLKGNEDFIDQLKSKEIYEHPEGKKGIEDLSLLFNFLNSFGILESFEIDLSLARGLDYYTGIIFEAVFDNYKEIGSVAGGGRYDNLVSSILSEKSSVNVPCVGFSFGITRILPILLKINQSKNISNLKVYLSSSGSLLLQERMVVLKKLWDQKIPSETFYNKRFNFNNALEYVQKNEIPFLMVLGEKEIKNNEYKLLYGNKKENKFTGNLEEVINFIKEN
ncbi:histidyl-tRNA synthetase [Tubulinosema ratisbonensis]|uniref:histidine--tRNA ligase n=1 Tax=Tubulinosema ratisbonensis TaxID=291195 RepID=A0A437APF8_9MICR|nr:histidyl-tRNA synthetase [Tubulinosema ratisbonensis]